VATKACSAGTAYTGTACTGTAYTGTACSITTKAIATRPAKASAAESPAVAQAAPLPLNKQVRFNVKPCYAFGQRPTSNLQPLNNEQF
jgi:hypothetical protein